MEIHVYVYIHSLWSKSTVCFIIKVPLRHLAMRVRNGRLPYPWEHTTVAPTASVQVDCNDKLVYYILNFSYVHDIHVPCVCCWTYMGAHMHTHAHTHTHTPASGGPSPS